MPAVEAVKSMKSSLRFFRVTRSFSISIFLFLLLEERRPPLVGLLATNKQVR
jgi:hypothetical protein